MRKRTWVLLGLVVCLIGALGFYASRRSRTPLDWPRSPERVVFQITFSGGFQPKWYEVVQRPSLTVFGDGKVLFDKRQIADRDLYVGYLPEEQLSSLLKLAEESLRGLDPVYLTNAPDAGYGRYVVATSAGIREVTYGPSNAKVEAKLIALEKAFRDALPTQTPRYLADEYDLMAVPADGALSALDWPAGLSGPDLEKRYDYSRIGVTGITSQEFVRQFDLYSSKVFRFGDRPYTVMAVPRIPVLRKP